MYFTQVLRIACGLKWLATVLAVLLAVIFVSAWATGAFSPPFHNSPDSGIPLPAFFAMAGFVASFFASRYARTLSEENEAHLAVALTKPVSRVRFALTVMAIDAIGIVAAFVLTMLSIAIFIGGFKVFHFIGAPFVIETPPDTALQFARYLALPFAFYGLMTALTASFGKAGRGLIGWGWCTFFLVGLLGALDFPPPWKAILTTLNYINPLTYAGYTHKVGHDTINIASGPNGAQLISLAVGWEAAALALLCVAGLAAGVLQWRRVEA